MPIIYLKLPFKLNAEKIDPYLNCRQKILLIQACFIMREMCYSSSLNFFHDILLEEIHSRKNVNQCLNLHMVSGMKYTFVSKLKQAQRRTCRKLGMSVKRCFVLDYVTQFIIGHCQTQSNGAVISFRLVHSLPVAQWV